MTDTTKEAVERNICNPIISHVHDGRGLSEKMCGEIIDTARALVAENERLRATHAVKVRQYEEIATAILTLIDQPTQEHD